ncbi:uncharacterized protein EI90DRAFT_3123708 [Cantharellus anzutake]|uniref:uncharacterized protein n=1 Tax=Cantharellus anzutake TaxID=1750568 RepID=UPI001906A6AC|nr:uncharacterized protein EI90DRAFT_3123708 [Cantharellus anzutake]KAF8331031.1 hypothetical protein EI90DRAFT_3123708 [Cantharellus anzutake]
MSGSMDPTIARPKMQNVLGFQREQFQDISLPIDHQDLVYGACILKHSIHGTEFPDLAWLVPNDLASPNVIRPTLIAVGTIAIADALVKWLRTQLKAFITEECSLVFPFHLIIPQEDRIQTLLELEQGLVQIVVTTTVGNVGLDMSVKDVIILDLPADFESMTQWNGQASRDGSGGHVIIYAPDEIQIENNFDLYGDQANKKKLSKNTLAAQVAYRDKCALGFVEYFNPGHPKCYQCVSCGYYDEPYYRPEQCCEAPGCTPGPPNDYQSATDHYMEKLT